MKKPNRKSILLAAMAVPLSAAAGAVFAANFLGNVALAQDLLAAGGQVAQAQEAPAAVLEERDPAQRAKAADRLARSAGRSNLEALIKLAESDPEPAVRKAIVDRLGRQDHPAVAEMLERRAASDPDAGVALLALERLRVHQAQRLGKIFQRRLELARSGGDAEGMKLLQAESQRWVSYARGATLPAFLQEPPPVFEAIPARASVRVLAIGDFGTGSEDMVKTAAAALAYHREHPCDLGLTAGDNFLSEGVTGTADPRWRPHWEDLYGRLNIPFFATTGNHDWGFADSPAAEILYSSKSATWRMPALYYSFTAGPVQFFALATQALSDAQLNWLDRELSRSTARWRVVYGHHPIYSHGAHGDTAGFDERLLPVLRNRAHIYLVGHEHTMQHLKPEDGVHLVITGAAGQSIRPAKTGPRTLYSGSFYGFTVIEAGPDELKFRFVDTEGKSQYEAAIN